MNDKSSYEQTTKKSHILQIDDNSKSFESNVMLYFLLTPKQKQRKYQKNIKALITLEKGRITEDDKNNGIKKIKSIISEIEDRCQEFISKCERDSRMPLFT